MLETELNWLSEIKEKYSTGNYICVVENKFGPRGYFVKENNSEFKLNWNYKLIHKKHQNILELYLKNPQSLIIFIIVEDCSYKVDDFIKTYDERYSYSSYSNA